MGEKKTDLMNMFPYLRSSLYALKNDKDENKLEKLNTKVENAPTLSVTIENRPYYLHSKYDPKKEAEVLIERYKDELEKYDHILFYGVGLGYHVETLLNRYPNMNYSLFEPVPSVFKHFLESNRLDALDLSRLKNIYIDTQNDNSKDFLINITETIQERIILIPLPSYERIFEQKSKRFAEDFKAAVAAKYESYYIDNKYSARWTLNSLINLPTTLSTPNILEGFEHVFKDKPLIIVSAGPSLQEEYENFKKIKRDKTAYIFAVGSANKALIANGIIPHAVCTYDPQDINHTVFTKMLEENVVDVPMIYGTSVGFETLKYYPGPKLHMITTQDTVTPFYITNNQDAVERINDAPTIAAVTLQLACKLGCSPVILAGQNLALKGKKIYSEDIKDNELEIDKENIIIVEDVNGQKIQTTKGFLNMKSYLEYYLNYYKNVEFINSTKGGAAINGARFQSLEDLIRTRLKTEVVKEDWYKQDGAPIYNTNEIISKTKLMEQSIDDFWKLNDQLLKALQKIDNLAKRKEIRKLDKTINLFNNKLNEFLSNDCYKVYVHPVNRTYYQAINIRTTEIRKEDNIFRKHKLILDSFLPYISRCSQTLEKLVSTIFSVHHETINLNNNHCMRYYPNDCGAFYYEGNWIKKKNSPGKSIDYSSSQMCTLGNSIIKFQFTGTKFKVIGSKDKGHGKNIEIIIDGKTDTLSLKRNYLSTHEVIYEKSNLKHKKHNVTIQIIDKNNFKFTGIEVDLEGKVHHINEVSEIKDLEIGKKIRCHYKANYNSIGEFSMLGSGKGEFLSNESSSFPDGDFYFIMVDGLNGEKKLVADRVIHNYVNWTSLKRGNIELASNYNCYIRAISEEEQEWEKYMLQPLKFGKETDIFNHDEKIASWTEHIVDRMEIDNQLTNLITIRGAFFHMNDYGETADFSYTISENYVYNFVGYRPVCIIKKKDDKND